MTAIENQIAEDEVYTFDSLPTGATQSQRAFVSDATTVTFYDVVVGGGTFTAPVFFDGTDWRIG